MIARRLFARLLVALTMALALLTPRVALSHWGEGGYKIEGRKRPELPADGPRGRAELSIPPGGILSLAPEADGMSGSFTLTNTGDGPLEIYRVGFEVDDAWRSGAQPRENNVMPRVPQGMGVSASTRESKPLAPGETRTFTIRWRWEETRVSQLHGYFIVETDSAAPGATTYDPVRAFPVIADHRPASLHHILSLVALAPLLLGLIAALGRSRVPQRLLRTICAGLAAACTALALVPLGTFSRMLGREDGSWGLQHVERFRLFGNVEYFVALDGLSAPVLPVIGLVLFCAIAATRSPRGGFATFVAASSIAASATTFFVVSQSLAVSAIALAVACLAMAVLVARSVDASGRAAAAKTLLALAIATVAFGWFALVVAKGAYPSRLFDGTTTTTTFAVPEIAREAAHGHGAMPDASRVLGLPRERGALLIVLIAFLALGAVAPLHGWAAELAKRAEAPTTAVVYGVCAILGLGLLRFTVALYPDAAAWLATPLVIVALPTLFLGGLRALFEDDLHKLVGHLFVATGALHLLSVASLTPQGLAGGLALATARALGAPLAVLVAGAIVERTGEASMAKGGGLARVAPRLAVAWLVAIATVGALPGSGGFWALCLTLIGAAGSAPWIAFAVAAGAALTAVAAARALRVVGAPEPDWWRTSSRLEPHGGVVPDLRRDELAWAGTLVVALVAITLASGSWLGLSDTSVLDVFRALAAPGATQVS